MPDCPLTVADLILKTGRRTRAWLLSATLLFLVLFAAPAVAQSSSGGGDSDIVTRVELKGLEGSGLSEELVRQQIRTVPGEPLRPDVLDGDMRRLWSELGVIVNEVIPEPGPDGVALTLMLTRNFSIDIFAFEGNDAKSDGDLEALIGVLPGHVRSRRNLTLAAKRIEEAYREEGYAFTEVQIELDEKNGNQRGVFHVYEGPRVAVDEIIFNGLVEVDDGDLRDVMETSRSWFIFSSYYKVKQLDRDITAIEAYLRSEGYLDARVSLEDVRFKDARDDVDIYIRVEEGPRFTVSSLDFSGIQAFEEEAIRELIKLKPGDPYRQTVVDLDLQAIVSYYGNRGYIRCNPEDPVEIYDLDEPKVGITYRINEGRRKRVRDVVIRGNLSTRDDVIRRSIPLYPGQWFDLSKVRRGVNRLRGLGYFASRSGASLVRVFPLPSEGHPDEEYLIVDVGEGLLGLLNFSVGTQSGRGAFVGISIDKPNFDISRVPSTPWDLPSEFFSHEAFHGGGQRLSLSLLPGTRESLFSIDFEEPYLFGPEELPWSLRMRIYKDVRLRRDYDEKRIGIRPTIGKTLVEDLRVHFTFRNEQIEVDDVDPDAPPDVFDVEGKNGLRSLGTRFVYDRRDNFRSPTEGYRTSINYEYAGGFLGADLDFSKAEAFGEVFIPLYREDEGRGGVHVLTFAARAGWAEAHSESDFVPIYERFYAGGQNNFLMRGFRYRGMGPHFEDDPIGGTAGLVANTEYIFPLISYFEDAVQEEVTFLKGFLFFDVGTLAEDLDSFSTGRLRASTGLGIRLRIPVAFLSQLPLTANYGIPFAKEPGDERRSFNFSFSTSF